MLIQFVVIRTTDGGLCRWFDINNIVPRFEFGFGLSYTTFAYSGLVTTHVSPAQPRNAPPAASRSIAPSTLPAGVTPLATKATSTASAPPAASSPVGNIGGPAALYQHFLTVSFEVKNTGAVAGNEVSQLYLGFPASYGEPPKVLRGFTRTMLTPGQSETVSIQLRQKDVSVWDVVAQKWVVGAGTFQVMVGSSSRAINLQGTFQL